MEENINYELINKAKKNLSNGEYITVRLLRFITSKVVDFSVKRMLNPNFLTLMMLVSVIIAVPCFLFNNPYLLIVGFIILQFFEVFDDADGIVARGTNQLSPYGEQLDFMMHMICHPIMICVFSYAMYINLDYQFFSFISNEMFFICLSFIFIVFEYIYRLNIDLDVISNLKIKKDKVRDNANGLLKCLWKSLSCFPVFMQLFPIVLIVDSFAGLNISIYIFIGFIVFWILNSLRITFFKLIKYSTKYKE